MKRGCFVGSAAASPSVGLKVEKLKAVRGSPVNWAAFPLPIGAEKKQAVNILASSVLLLGKDESVP